MDKVSTEMQLNVFDDNEGVCISVSIGPDFPSVRVYNKDPASIDYWGKIDFTVSKEIAKALGEAMIRVANTVEE